KNQITNEGLQSVGLALAQFPNLKSLELNLNYNQIDLNGCLSLCSSLEHIRNLLILNLSVRNQKQNNSGKLKRKARKFKRLVQVDIQL
ncbi:hypothetical protein ABPG74_019795, partial [Tetrahymena malaccensis]